MPELVPEEEVDTRLGWGRTSCLFLKLLVFRSALPPCETSPKRVQRLCPPLLLTYCHTTQCEKASFSLHLSFRKGSRGRLMGAQSLLQRGDPPLCASLGYSECAFLTGYLGVNIKHRYLV